MTEQELPGIITAAVLVIGDEILSGRTQDVNIAAIARFLGVLGIDLAEARVVPDVEDEIVAAVNALRRRHDYVFTTGGIGPTHDDITADAIGKAFGVPVEYHAEALALLEARYKPGEFNEMRRRMARIPKGGTLVKNTVSVAPGFQIENVIVMAGVPKIMQAMLEAVAPNLRRGVPVVAKNITVFIPEGRIAAELKAIQEANQGVSIGSYPFFADPGSGRPAGTVLVVRGRQALDVEAAAAQIECAARAQGVEPKSSLGHHIAGDYRQSGALISGI